MFAIIFVQEKSSQPHLSETFLIVDIPQTKTLPRTSQIAHLTFHSMHANSNAWKAWESLIYAKWNLFRHRHPTQFTPNERCSNALLIEPWCTLSRSDGDGDCDNHEFTIYDVSMLWMHGIAENGECCQSNDFDFSSVSLVQMTKLRLWEFKAFLTCFTFLNWLIFVSVLL